MVRRLGAELDQLGRRRRRPAAVGPAGFNAGMEQGQRHYPTRLVLADAYGEVECICGWATRIVHDADCDCGAADLVDLVAAAGATHALIEARRAAYLAAYN